MAASNLLTFGQRLRQHRLEAGLTQAALAERAGISPAAVTAIERGVNRRPHPDTVARLARALQLAEGEAAAFAASVSRARHRVPAAGADHVGPPGPGTGPLLPTPHNLPVSLPPLLGREREEAAAVHLLRRGQAAG
jgi:transcriptional regulator with XRE-family HTH domain